MKGFLTKLWAWLIGHFGQGRSNPVPILPGFGEQFDGHEIANRLLRANYLPRQRSDADELPPVFSSDTFTLKIANKFEGLSHTNPKRGFDGVHLTLTRHDGHQRACMIPHPAAYAKLVLVIRENWDKISHICDNRQSYIRPRLHDDGRLFVMAYNNWTTTTLGALKQRLSNGFIVKADIASFYPSIYSHAIPWSLVNMSVAKASNGKEWYDKIDKAFRDAKRGETNGVSIGPGTSNIAAELILWRVDDALRKEFVFHRYIDDYTCYTNTSENAEKFFDRLRSLLAKYNLALNVKKCETLALPDHNESAWIFNVRQRSLGLRSGLKPGEVLSYISYLTEIANKYSDNNVYKYGFKVLSGKISSYNSRKVALISLLGLCQHVPNLLSSLIKFKINIDDFKKEGLDNHLQNLLLASISREQTDNICWCLFLINAYDGVITEKAFDKLLFDRDCLPLLLAYCYGNNHQKSHVIKFAKRAVAAADAYDRHQYWILVYELMRRGAIAKGGPETEQYKMMMGEGVVFCDG